MKALSAVKWLGLLIISLVFSACGEKEHKWEKTKEGALIYINNDSFFGGDFSWTGDTLMMGVANGPGILSFEDNLNSDNNFKKKVNLNFGSKDNDASKIGKIDDKGRLQGFGVKKKNDDKVIIGEFDDDKADGEGVIYESGIISYVGNLKNDLPQGKGTQYFPNGQTEYKGKFKKGRYQGKGRLYNSSGRLIYEGSFADGKYNGYGVLYDSLGHTESHVWTAGTLDKVTASYYNRLAEFSNKLTPRQIEKCSNRFLTWERYHVWMYIGWSVFFILLFLICLGSLDEEENAPYNRTKPWNKYKVWLDWLFVGWLGCHRYVLRSKAGLLYFVPLLGLFVANLRELCLYLFYPSTWGMWQLGSFSYCCLAAIAIFLLFDFFYIPWRCYSLNSEYYRHDRNEELILRDRPTDIMTFAVAVPDNADKNANAIQQTLKVIKKTHEQKFQGKTGFFTKVGRALSGNDPWLRFEQDRARTLQSECKKAEKAQNSYAAICENINAYLEESRRNAYRNFSLAKELIALAIKTKKSKTELSCDVALDDSRLSIVTSIESISEIEAGIDWENTTKNAFDATKSLLCMGIKGPWAIGVGIGASLLSGALDAINKAERACEEANKQCATAIEQLSHINDAVINSHAQILRAAEIIVALNKANQAFWNAYASLRDEVFSDRPSFSEFIFGARVPSHLRNDEEFRNRVVHLIQVCSEYNKINQAKL